MLGPDPLDFNEPKSTQLRKASEGTLWYALRRYGWTDEQIYNGLRTHHAGILDEAADWVADKDRRSGLGWESARDVLLSKAAEIRRERTYGDPEWS